MDHLPDDEASDLTLLRSARPEPTAGAEVAESHRAALDAAMRGERTSPLRRPRARRLAVAAAALPVLAGAVALAARSGDQAPDLEMAASDAFYNAPRCGEEPSPAVTIPAGYSGPIEGPSDDSTRDVAPDQLVRHWTAPSGSIELRWYADPGATPPGPAPTAVDDAPPQGAGLSDDGSRVIVVSPGQPVAGARVYVELAYSVEGQDDDPCTWVQLRIFDDDPSTALSTAAELLAGCAEADNLADAELRPQVEGLVQLLLVIHCKELGG